MARKIDHLQVFLEPPRDFLRGGDRVRRRDVDPVDEQ
jgi:hypothetical protein